MTTIRWWKREIAAALRRPGAAKRYALVAVFSVAPAYAARQLAYPYLAPSLAKRAEATLRQDKAAPLSEPLAAILSDSTFTPVATENHPLLGKPAPDLELRDHEGKPARIRSISPGRPLVIVFYYGYYCSHCVSQLFGINEDIALFKELGADVVAISADPPSLTAERYREFGAFAFPVLSDPDQVAGRAYGVYTPAADGQPEDLVHATFLVDATGVIRWANRGKSPFYDNKTLLAHLADFDGLDDGKHASVHH